MTFPTAMPAGLPAERRYQAFSRFLKERFGTKVYRVTVDAGFTCPNVDGTVAVGGCVYCDNRSFSPNRRLPRTSIREQVARGVTLTAQCESWDIFIPSVWPRSSKQAIQRRAVLLPDVWVSR